MMYEQGEILIVPFPFSDLSSIKQRPVLVLSKDIDNTSSNDVITCGITSFLKDTKYSIIKKKLAKLNKKTFEKVRKEFFNLT